MTYYVGIDLASKDGDYYGVCIAEQRGKVTYVLGSGTSKDLEIAIRDAQSDFLRNQPWYKRPYCVAKFGWSYLLGKVVVSAE